MKMPRSEEIAKMFMLAEVYAGGCQDRWGMPKLNGERAMWIPGVGFMTKHGLAYADGVLPHLEAALRDTKLWLDGEFYTHGQSLQWVHARAAVNRTKPHADHLSLGFHVFDSPLLAGGVPERQAILHAQVPKSPHIHLVEHKFVKCPDKARALFTHYVALGYEGLMLKSAGHYTMGLSRDLLKWKAWDDAEFDVIDWSIGLEGKYDHTLGSITCRAENGELFNVGSFAFDDAERESIWVGPKPKRAKVKFLARSDRGVPYNTQCLCLET